MRKTRQIQAVVFDFDGTLVDSNDIKRQAYDVAFDGTPNAKHLIARILATYPARDRAFIIKSVVNQLQRDGKLRRTEAARLRSSALRTYSRFCRDGVGIARDFRGVTSTLRILARNYRLAINSGTQQDQLRQLIRARNWGAYCELILGAPSTKVRNLERIARRFKVRPAEMVFVGDSCIDADAAERFGCAFIYAAYRQKSSPEIWACVSTFGDLPNVLSRLDY